MLIDDLIDVGNAVGAVPDPVGIDHQNRSQAATIETTSIVDAYAFESCLFHALFEMVAQGHSAFVGTAAAWIVRAPLVGANKYMKPKIWGQFGHAVLLLGFAVALEALPKQLLQLFDSLYTGG
jgi:hypothetical protein